MESSLELLSRAALNVQEHEAALELSKLPAKKKLLSQLKHQQQNAIQNQVPSMPSSISLNPINQAHSTTNLINSNKDSEPMDQDDDDEEINVHDDDSPLDMRITKNDSDRPSVIRRAPSFKETSNSPSCDPTSTCDPFIDEHFRRSLGTDYDLIIRNKLEQEQLAQKQRMMEEQQQQAAGVQVQQQQNILKLKHHKKHQIHQHQQMLAAKHSQAIATPPTTPSPPTLAQLPMQQSPVPTQAQKPKAMAEHSDWNEMAVDDHFAKALGDKWKQFQNDGK